MALPNVNLSDDDLFAGTAAARAGGKNTAHCLTRRRAPP